MLEVFFFKIKTYMDTLTSLTIVALAAFIHASFQLSVSVLTLLSGHALGAKKSYGRVMRMTASYVCGAAVMTLLLVSFVSLVVLHIFGTTVPLVAWAGVCGVALGFGVAVWLFYYRRGRPGTELWIPRSFALYLSQRSKKTQNSVEAFSLGLTGVVSELLFIIPSLFLTAFVLVNVSPVWQLVGLGLYALIATSGLVVVWALVGSGHSLSSIQRWRERNKIFLQFSSGSALMVLGFFVYVSQVVASVAGAL